MPWSTCPTCRKGFYSKRGDTQCTACRPHAPRPKETRVHSRTDAPTERDRVPVPVDRGFRVRDEHGREVDSLELARRYHREIT